MLSSLRSRALLGMKIEVLLARNVSRDIGQPTHYTHPELLGEDEGKLLVILCLYGCMTSDAVFQ